MELHPQAQAVLEHIASLGYPPITEVSPEEAREIRRAHISPSAIELDEIRDVDAGGVPARLYRPSGEDDLGLLVYFHGGGWVVGDLETHDSTCRALAAESGHAVLAVDYRLAPEHPFPAAYDDALAATHWASSHAAELGCAPDKLADRGRLGRRQPRRSGDAAGCGAAPLPVARLPGHRRTLQHELVWGLRRRPVPDAGVDGLVHRPLPVGRRRSRDDPRVSPLLGDDDALAKSPPTHVVTVETDVLRDEGEAYAARLESAGVPTTLRRYEGMFHGFFALPELIDVGRDAVREAARDSPRRFR